MRKCSSSGKIAGCRCIGFDFIILGHVTCRWNMPLPVITKITFSAKGLNNRTGHLKIRSGDKCSRKLEGEAFWHAWCNQREATCELAARCTLDACLSICHSIATNRHRRTLSRASCLCLNAERSEGIQEIANWPLSHTCGSIKNILPMSNAYQSGKKSHCCSACLTINGSLRFRNQAS